MKQDYFDFQQCFRDLLASKPWLFEPKVAATNELSGYLSLCGYDPSRPPFLGVSSIVGTYYPDFLDKYSKFFLFNKRASQESVLLESYFNFQDHFHLIVNWINYPEPDSINPRLLCSPILYSDSAHKMIQFVRDNEEFLVRPAQKRGVGFL